MVVSLLQDLLQEMVETYGDRIYRLALRYTGNRTQAEDIAQETFLRAYKNLDRYDRSRPAGPWLFKIATNICRNWLRDNREVMLNIKEVYNRTPNPGPEELYLAREGEEELFQVIYQLPEKYRTIILLKHVSELSYSEIAETLDLEMSLVKNRLYRGRLMLRNMLSKRNGGYYCSE